LSDKSQLRVEETITPSDNIFLSYTCPITHTDLVVTRVNARV
jgi:hypothetical protein